MSLYDTPDTVPSRVAGIVRSMLGCRDFTCRKDDLLEWMSPTTLRRDRASQPDRMASDVIGECIKMGLLSEYSEGESTILTLSEATRSSFSNGRYSDNALKRLLVSILADPENDRNHNYCRTVYWLLCQNPYSVTITKSSLLNLILQQSGGDRLGLNNERWGALQDWSTFLGFGWNCSVGTNGELLVPDPTMYFRLELGALFSDAGDDTLTLGAFMSELLRRCPMLPGGAFGDYFRDWKLPFVEDNEVPTSMALALSRLHEVGCVELIRRADALGFTFADGESRQLYTHIAWNGGAK